MSPVAPYDAADKHSAVRAMFDRIAPGYDTVNRAMTLGLDGLWRRRAAESAALQEGGIALDVGTGTGDLAFALARSAAGATVVGLDYAGQMLARAPAKARALGLDGRATWLRGDGQRLPFPDATFDVVASGFVLRNFADLETAVAEMARVLVPGGRFVALEASPDGSLLWRLATRGHFALVVPAIGALLTGHRSAYTYLGRSVGAFLAPTAFATIMESAGLMARPPILTMGGSIAIHRAVKA